MTTARPWLISIVFFCGWFWPRPAASHGQCLPASGSTHFCDLLDGSTQGAQQGGTWVADGWRVDAFGNQITWDLGAQMTSGTLRLHVRGIDLSALNRDNHHFVEVFDHQGGFAHDARYFTAVRTWSNTPGNEDWFGKLKFQFGATQAGPAGCGDEANLGSWDPNAWQPDRWFEIEIAFGQGAAVLRIDGTQIASVDYGGCDATLRFINIPNDPWVEGVIDPIVGAVYSTVSFDGTPACEAPCSDNNPCTDNDACEGATCVGVPVSDGTPCDDGDSFTEDTCQDGVCVGFPPQADSGNGSDAAATEAGQDSGWTPVGDGSHGGAAGSDADDASGEPDGAARADAATGAAPGQEADGCACDLSRRRPARPVGGWMAILAMGYLGRRRAWLRR